MGHRACLDTLKKKSLVAAWDTNHDSSVVKSAAQSLYWLRCSRLENVAWRDRKKKRQSYRQPGWAWTSGRPN